MKNVFVQMAVTTMIVVTVLFSTLSAPNRLDENLPALSSSDLTFEEACQCVHNPVWVPAPLDRSLRPVTVPQLDPTILPVDVSLKKNQEGCGSQSGFNCSNCFECYAWQLFIALNWPVVSHGIPKLDAKFGEPGDRNAVVWETYKSIYDIFSRPGRKLPVWDRGNGAKLLQSTSAVDRKSLIQELQADRNWLTDQNGELVRYETKVNKDIYEYIRNNNLHNQEGIYKAFTDPARDGIRLPDGSAFKPGEPGSIEIKAAWRIVPPGKLADFQQRYKISDATIPGRQGKVQVALVGLHIIKKTPNSPQFVWATFEHKENAPNSDEHPDPESKWNFYNPKAGDDVVPNWHTPPQKVGPDRTDQTTPVQVKREKSFRFVDKKDSINDRMHKLIRARFPESVWLNYVLVTVQWPQKPEAQPHKATERLPLGTPSPDYSANLTMETYLQGDNTPGTGGPGKSSCIGCHSRVASTPSFISDNQEKRWKTDYSAIFFKAKAAPSSR
jgi:hypothetical protein